MATITVWVLIMGYHGAAFSPIGVVDNIASEEECKKLVDALKFPMRGTCLPVLKAK